MYIILQVNRLGMDVQVDFFNITRKEIDKLLGPSKGRDHIMKKSIFSITIGANDFLNNYLLPVLSIGARITQSPNSFIDDMISNLRNQLTVINNTLSLVLIKNYLSFYIIFRCSLLNI